ncbi:MAG: hypothetical protein WAM04_01715, partial [Candidatus Sulfotelmatobacter sp.]
MTKHRHSTQNLGIGSSACAGDVQGRRSPEQITVYKPLGHVVQDLASDWRSIHNPMASLKPQSFP